MKGFPLLTHEKDLSEIHKVSQEFSYHSCIVRMGIKFQQCKDKYTPSTDHFTNGNSTW